MKTSNLNARIRSHFPQIDEDGKKINFIENILPVLKQKPFEFNKLLEVLKNQASQQSASMHRQCTEALIKFINSSDFSFLRQDRYKKTSYLFGGITFVTSTSEFKQFNQGLSDYLTGLEEVDAIQNSSSSAVGGVIAAGILGFLRTCLSSAAKSPGNALCTLLVFSRQMVGVMSDSNAAVPGGGYSNDMQMTTVTPCFDVNQTYIGSSSGLVQFGSTITFDQLEESLNVNVEAEAGIGGFSASASASYANMVKDTAYSASFIFNNLIKFPQLLVQPMGYAEDALNNFGKEVYEKGHDNFGITCGDRAITRISTGASLYAAVRVNFATQEEKSEYSGKMKAGITGLGSVARSIKAVVEASEIQGGIDVIAYQIGGEPSKLTNIFKKNPKGGYYVTSCNFQGLNACSGVIDGVLDYGINDFSKQVGMENGKVVGTNPTPASTGQYTAKEIRYLGLTPSPSFVNQTVVGAREQLWGVLSENIYYAQSLDRLQYYPAPFDYTARREITQLLGAVIANVGVLQDQQNGAIQCFIDPADCVVIAARLNAELRPIDSILGLAQQLQYRIHMAFDHMGDGYWYPVGGNNSYYGPTPADPTLDFHGTMNISSTQLSVNDYVCALKAEVMGWAQGPLNKVEEDTYMGTLAFFVNGRKTANLQRTAIVSRNPYAFYAWNNNTRAERSIEQQHASREFTI